MPKARRRFGCLGQKDNRKCKPVRIRSPPCNGARFVYSELVLARKGWLNFNAAHLTWNEIEIENRQIGPDLGILKPTVRTFSLRRPRRCEAAESWQPKVTLEALCYERDG